jgi:hypothetical protein
MRAARRWSAILVAVLAASAARSPRPARAAEAAARSFT